MIHTCFLSLGSNIPPERVFLKKAITSLADLKFLTISSVSSLYISAPIGYRGQSDFHNCVCKIVTRYTPRTLLRKIQLIEQKLKRRRTIKFGPRTIDIDILLYDSIILKSSSLHIPHPELLNRNFVIKPLLEIEKDLVFPGTGETIDSRVRPCVARQRVKRLVAYRWYS